MHLGSAKRSIYILDQDELLVGKDFWGSATPLLRRSIERVSSFV